MIAFGSLFIVSKKYGWFINGGQETTGNKDVMNKENFL